MEEQKQKYQKPKITQIELDPEVSAAKGCKTARTKAGPGDDSNCKTKQCKDLGS